MWFLRYAHGQTDTKRDTPIAISLVQGGEMKMWTRNERSRVVSACSEGTISFPLVVGKKVKVAHTQLPSVGFRS